MSVTRPSFHISYAAADNVSEANLAFLLYDQNGQLLQICFGKKSCPAINMLDGTIDFEKMQASVVFIIVAVALNGSRFSRLELFSAELQFRQGLMALMTTSPSPVHNFAPLLLKRIGGTVAFQGIQVNAMDNVVGNAGGIANIWRLADFVLQSQIPPHIWAQFPHSHVELLALKQKQKVSLPRAVLGQDEDQAISFFGLGWSPDKRYNVDLDAHVYTIDSDRRKIVDHVFYNNKTSKDSAFRLDGDDRTGDGKEGDDDERIFVSLDRVSHSINVVFIVIRIHNDGKHNCPTFAQVKNEFCRVADKSRQTVLYFSLDGVQKFEGARNVVMCALCRDAMDMAVWNVQAIGESVEESLFSDDKKIHEALVKLL